MSSSLDDLEPHEFFQHELDEKLKQYQKSVLLTSLQAIVLNRFIEFVCIDRNLSSVEEISDIIIEKEFIEHFTQGAESEEDRKNYISLINGFLSYSFPE